MKTAILYFSGFIAIYIIFLLVLTPASTVTDRVQYPKNISLGKVSGTIWSSHIDKININNVIIEDVHIDLNFLSLLTFKPAITVNFGDNLGRGPKGKATISGSLEALVVEQLNIQVQADLIAQQLPLPIPIEAKDSVDVVINRFVMGKPLCTEINGSIVWPNAAVTALNEQVTLGRLATKLDCQRGQIELMVDPNNDLGLTFTAAIGRNFKTSGKGFLSVNNKTPEAIKQLTPFLGKPDREGRYVLTF